MIKTRIVMGVALEMDVQSMEQIGVSVGVAGGEPSLAAVMIVTDEDGDSALVMDMGAGGAQEVLRAIKAVWPSDWTGVPEA